jgi:hypothetical protein
MGVMTDDRFDRLLRDAAQDYHRPPATPREEMWRRIAAVRATRRVRGQRTTQWLGWGAAIAAVLLVGIGIGRWSMRAPDASRAPVATAGGAGEPGVAYRVAAAQYLTRTEALLTGFRTETRSDEQNTRFAAQARDLLMTTRLMLDSPAAQDATLRTLLQDLELVLAQIAQLSGSSGGEDVQLINQGLEQRSVLLRLRTAVPAGPSLQRTQGAL